MSDVNVEKWNQTGHLYLWHYLENQRNYLGWHMTVDKSFCSSFVNLVERMLSSNWRSQKLITLTAPTPDILRLPGNRAGNSRWYTKKNILLKHVKEFTEDHLILEEKDAVVVLSASSQKLKFLENCMTGIFQGKNDYSIAVGEERLWIW